MHQPSLMIYDKCIYHLVMHFTCKQEVYIDLFLKDQ